MFNRTRKRMMLAALAAMSLAGAGAQGKAELPIDGTTARTMAIGGERRANSLDFPTPPDYSTGRVGVIGSDDSFYSNSGSTLVPSVHSEGTESPVYQAFDSPQVSDFDFLVVSFGIPSDVFDNSICQVMLGEDSPIPFKAIFGWQMDGVGSDSLSLVMRASSVRRQQDEGTLLEAVQAMFPVVDVNEAMSATGDNNELMSALAGNLKVAVSGFVDRSVVQDGETAEVYVNVDDPLTIDQILANVSAEDLLGETVEVQCTETEKQKYQSSTIGTYTITVTATDKYGQTATCYLEIHVVDVVPPEIELVSPIVLDYGDELTDQSVKEHIRITDNGTSHGGTIGDPSYMIDGTAMNRTGGWTWEADEVGTHTLKVTVADSSGNSSTKEFQITVRDVTAPTITMKDGADGNLLIGLSRVLSFTEAEFLALFQATDDVTPSDEIVLDVEGSFIPSKVGNYDIKVIATDKAGNKGSYTCHVTVDADLPPVFILSDALVGATAENPLSGAQIQTIVKNAIYAGRTVNSVKIDDADYQANATREGSYPVPYSVEVLEPDGSLSTEEGKLTVRVSGRAAEEEEKTGWDRFCEWWTVDFVQFWQKLGNWFRGVFTKWKFDCFITNEEWDARFPTEDAAE